MIDRRLIIDVGFHRGEDAQFYMDKGFRVVGVEANPALIEEAHRKFARELDAGKLVLYGVAIAERTGTAKLTVVDNITGWSSLRNELVRANAALEPITWHEVDVQCVRFETILEFVGIPYYLKVDVEGLDMACIRALRQFTDRPAFVSLESAVAQPGATYREVREELALLYELGYSKFAYVNQNMHPYRVPYYPPREGSYVHRRLTPEHSGYFGDDLHTPWLPHAFALAYGTLLRTQYDIADPTGTRTVDAYRRAADAWWRLRHRDSHGTQRWYDLHARRTA